MPRGWTLVPWLADAACQPRAAGHVLHTLPTLPTHFTSGVTTDDDVRGKRHTQVSRWMGLVQNITKCPE